MDVRPAKSYSDLMFGALIIVMPMLRLLCAPDWVDWAGTGWGGGGKQPGRDGKKRQGSNNRILHGVIVKTLLRLKGLRN